MGLLINSIVPTKYWWWIPIYIYLVIVFGFTVIRFTLLEPDRILIDDNEVSFLAGGRTRAIFKTAELKGFFLDDKGFSITGSGHQTIIPAKYFTPYDWNLITTSILRLAPIAVVRDKRLNKSKTPNKPCDATGDNVPR
jgi:hypothetical protein